MENYSEYLIDEHDPLPDCDCKRCAITERNRLRAELAASQAECERLSSLYEELLFAVEYKHPSETRHQTALRYIRQFQTQSASIAFDKLAGEVKP